MLQWIYTMQTLHNGWAKGGACTVYSFQITEELAGRKLGSILQSEYKMSRRLLRHLINSDGVKVEGQTVYLTTRMEAGQRIEVELPLESSHIPPEKIDLDIRYEDEEVIVINKQPGILTHPTAHERTGSLLAGVSYYLHSSGQVPHCVHRLDRDTSGVVMFAKHAHTHHVFDMALRARKMHRLYVALVYCADIPKLETNEDGYMTIDLPIAEDPDHPSRRVISPDGQRAITHCRIWDKVGKVAIAGLVLDTGRTHQIRLHMASVGLPLIGDRDYTMAYAGKEIPRDADSYRRMLQRQGLHAYQLHWVHPVVRSETRVSAPVYGDMMELWSELGGNDSVWDTILKSNN